LIANQGFLYKREIKKRIKKISDILEECKSERTGKENAGMKTMAVCLKRL